MVPKTFLVQNKPRCYSVQLLIMLDIFLSFWGDFQKVIFIDSFWKIFVWFSVRKFSLFKKNYLNFEFGFNLVWFSCIPSFNLLLWLELVKKFSVVGGGGGGWWWLKATLVFIFAPRLGLWLRPRPKLNNFGSTNIWVKILYMLVKRIITLYPVTGSLCILSVAKDHTVSC